MIDLDDPTPAPHEFRVYADDLAQVYAIVDEEDYHRAIQHKWVKKESRGKAGKLYLRRAVGENRNGQRIRTFTLYLHVEIMHWTGIKPISAFHTIVDHRNGNSLDCRRANLRWATPRMNNLNLYGQNPYDLEELSSSAAPQR